MSSERSSPGLAAQLRASAHEPEDQTAAELRARLRHKMFGVGELPPAPPAPDVPAEPRFEARATRFAALARLAWLLPCVAMVSVAGWMAWRRRAPAEIPERAQPIRLPALVGFETGRADRPPAVPPNDGPGLLDAAERELDATARQLAETDAVRASWADAAAPRRIEATVRLASSLREDGEPGRAMLLLRAVLDDLELRTSSANGRVQLLTEVAQVYEDLGRSGAAEAARREAQRLASG